MTSAWHGIRRFLRYNVVGVMGLAVKFSVLTGLVELAGVGYLAATALAVEAAVMHNFVWHLSWTWRDRSTRLSWQAALLRLLKFHLAIGSVGMLTNLATMHLLAQGLGLHYIAAGVIATCLSGMANFALSNYVVFLPARVRPSASPTFC